MKKIIICFVILLSLMLTCCAKQQKEYKVTIYDIDGNIYQELSSIDFVVPKMPEVTGYQFKEFQEAIPDEITKDLELHPIYEPIMHKVSFMSGDGSLFLEVDVRDGEKVTIPSAVPTNELWAFDGWDFDFDTVIKEDTRIRGIWHQVKYSI